MPRNQGMSVYGYTFGRVPDALLFSGTDRACRLYAILTRWADLRPHDHPTRGELAGLLGCSVDTVDRTKEELVDGTFLEVKPQYIGATKLRDANDWHLLPGPEMRGDPFGYGRTHAATITSGNDETAGQDGRTHAATADQGKRETAGQDGRTHAATSYRKNKTLEGKKESAGKSADGAQPRRGRPKVEPSAEAWELAHHLADTIAERTPEVGRPNVTPTWALDMDKLLRLGVVGYSQGFKPEQVRWLIDWLAAGECRDALFWRRNVRSPAKLRVHAAELIEAAQTNYQGVSGRPSVASVIRASIAKEVG
jgi:hypothetical protein